MNFKTITLFLSLSVQLNIYAESQTGKNASLVKQERGMEYLIETIPGVKKQYNACVESKASDLQECMWNGSEAHGINPLAENDRRLVQSKLAEHDNDKNLSIESLDLSSATQGKDEGDRILGQYLYDRLQEKLFAEGNNNDKKNRVIKDHTQLNELYKSQLGKNLIETISNYCLHADDPSKKDDCDNDDQTKTYCPIYNKSTDNSHKLSDSNYRHEYVKCFESIGLTCRFKGETEACLVTKHMSNVKQSIRYLDTVQNRWNELKKKGVANTSAIKNSDEIINISSTELVEKSGLKAHNEAHLEFLKKCETEYEANKVKCDEYLIDKKDATAMKAEMGLRHHAQSARFNDALDKNSEKTVKDYLLNEGIDQKTIDDILKDKARFSTVKEQIKNKYEKEKEALLKSLNDQINHSPTTQDPSTGETPDFSELVKEEKNTQKLKEAVQFANMTAAFFAVCESDPCGDDEKQYNTSALKLELADSQHDPSTGRGTASEGSSDISITDFQNAHADILNSSGSDDSSSKTLEIDQINKLLWDISNQ